MTLEYVPSVWAQAYCHGGECERQGQQGDVMRNATQSEGALRHWRVQNDRVGCVNAEMQIAPIMVMTQYFVSKAGAPQPDRRMDRTLFKDIEISQDHQRQCDCLQQGLR